MGPVGLSDGIFFKPYPLKDSTTPYLGAFDKVMLNKSVYGVMSI